MSLYEGDMSSRLIAGEKMEDVLKKPDAPKTDWKLGNWSGGINPYDMYTNVTTTRVLCKDGTVAFESSSENAKYDNSKTCINNGGRAEIKPVVNAPQFKTPTQQQPESDLQYYTSAKFLKRASISIVPVGLIGAYCYHKKFSLLKSALLVSIPIVAITGLQYIGMGGGKNKYWGIFVPPSIQAKSIKKIQLQP